MTTDERGPLGSECNAELGPLLDEWAVAVGHVWMQRGGEWATGWAVRRADLEQLVFAAVAAGRERCAKLCDLHSRLTWNDDRKAQSRLLADEIRRGA